MRKIVIAVLAILAVGVPSWAGAAINDVRVSNHTNSAVTISWITDGPASGEARYSTSPGLSNPFTARDVRNTDGQVYLGRTHYVNLRNLQKETTYYFEVASGSEVDNNSGGYYTFRTMKAPSSPPGICLLYGHVYHEGGTAPAEGAIVFLRVTHRGVQSYPLSRLIGGNGSFLFNIKEARSTVTNNIFSTITAGDPIYLEAIYCVDCSADTNFTYSVCTFNCGSLILPSPSGTTTTVTPSSTTSSTSTTTTPGVTTTSIPQVTTSAASSVPTTIPPPPPPPPKSTTTTVGGASTTSSVRSTTTTTAVKTSSSTTSSSATTSVVISTSTTTTSIPSLWPLAYEELWGVNKEKNLSHLRSFRDNRIAKNELGKEYLGLLYGNSAEIATLIIKEPALGSELKKVIDELLPHVNALQKGQKVRISKQKVTHIDSVLKRFQSKASPQLKQAIKKVRRDIRKGTLFKQFGMVSGSPSKEQPTSFAPLKSTSE